MTQLKTLLLIKPGSFGDIIHAIPCAAALKEFLPDTRITWLVDERWEPLLTDNPVVDSTITFPREQFRGIAGMLRSIPWALRLEDLRPDVALDLQGLLRSALMARLAARGEAWEWLTRAKAQGGFMMTSRLCATESIPCSGICESWRPLALPKVTTPVFPLPPGTPAMRALHGNTPFILLHPFARGEGKVAFPSASHRVL